MALKDASIYLVMRTDMDNAIDFLTVETAALLVGRSHWTVRSWIHKGLLTRYKSASRTVVSRTELLERVKPTVVTHPTPAQQGTANA